MVAIMTEAQKYVPLESDVAVKPGHFHNILFGEDQFTVPRA